MFLCLVIVFIVGKVLGVEGRLAKLEGIVGQMDKRLASVEGRLNHIETRLESMEKELRGEIVKNFRWTIGIMLSILIPMWVTIILAIILK